MLLAEVLLQKSSIALCLAPSLFQAPFYLYAQLLYGWSTLAQELHSRMRQQLWYLCPEMWASFTTRHFVLSLGPELHRPTSLPPLGPWSVVPLPPEMTAVCPWQLMAREASQPSAWAMTLQVAGSLLPVRSLLSWSHLSRRAGLLAGQGWLRWRWALRRVCWSSAIWASTSAFPCTAGTR